MRISTQEIGTLINTCNKTFNRSKGAVTVLDTAPAMPPATRWRHETPTCEPFGFGNSGGQVSCSPISIICIKQTINLLCLQAIN